MAIISYPRYSQSYSFDTAISLEASCEAVLTRLLIRVAVTLFLERSNFQWDSFEAGLFCVTNTLSVVHVTLSGRKQMLKNVPVPSPCHPRDILNVFVSRRVWNLCVSLTQLASFHPPSRFVPWRASRGRLRTQYPESWRTYPIYLMWFYPRWVRWRNLTAVRYRNITSTILTTR